jgi:hypothetical protein
VSGLGGTRDQTLTMISTASAGTATIAPVAHVTSASNQPPTYPAAAPTTTPTTVAQATHTSAEPTVSRIAYRSCVRKSLLSTSVPSR